MIEFIKEYQTIIQLVATVLMAAVVNYLQLKFQVKQMKEQINGVGGKVSKLNEAQSKGNERLARIEGYLEAKNAFSRVKDFD